MSYYARDLIGRDLSNRDLRDKSFVHNFLFAVNFNGCDLRGVDLSRSQLNQATFVGADVAGANFTKCKRLDLTGAKNVHLALGLRPPRPKRPARARKVLLLLAPELHGQLLSLAQGANLDPRQYLVNLLKEKC